MKFLQALSFAILFLVAVAIGFGIWYALLYMFTSLSNPLLWKWWLKILYVLLGSYATSSITKIIFIPYLTRKNEISNRN